MRKIGLLLSWVLLVVPALTQTSPPKIQLLETGGFHGDEVKARTGEKWLGLYVTRRGSSLIPSTVQVKRIVDEVNDPPKSGQMTGKEVSVDQKNKPVFLIKSVGMMKPGAVVTVYKGGQDLPHALTEKSVVNLKLGQTNYQLKIVSHLRSSGERVVPPGAELIFTSDSRSQTLYKLNDLADGINWYLLWAGDVDGDGKLDLYLSLSDNENVTEHRLFLSHQARAGQLAQQVAKFRTTGC